MKNDELDAATVERCAQDCAPAGTWPAPDRLSEEERDIRWAVNYLLEQIAKKFEAHKMLDIWRLDAASIVRSFKHDFAASQPEAEPVAWLRDLQPDAEDEALAVCNRIDPGAFAVYTSPRLDRERLALETIKAVREKVAANRPLNSPVLQIFDEAADAIMRETR